MALVTTMSGVIGVLAAMALLLWFSAYIETRHLGPVTSADRGRSADDDGAGLMADLVAIEAPATADPLTSAA